MKLFFGHTLSFFPPRGAKGTGQSGQTFVEFILLLAIIFILTIVILRGFNVGIANFWEAYVQIIANPTTSEISVE